MTRRKKYWSYTKAATESKACLGLIDALAWRIVKTKKYKHSFAVNIATRKVLDGDTGCFHAIGREIMLERGKRRKDLRDER